MQCVIHYVLQKQSFSDDESFDLPLIYHLNGHSLHFGRRQFCLVTGFKFGLISLREHRNGDIPFRNRLFPEKIGYDVKIIDVLAFIEDEEKFSKVSDEDAIRLCLLLSLEVIFMGRELVSVVDDAFLRMVNYLDAWNSFPWGEHIWRQLYDSIRNVCSKHKLEHLDGLRKNPNHVPSYTLSGFLFAFKIWIIESSCESHRWWTRVPEIIPRAVSWTRTAECLKWEYFAELFDKTPIELSPTKAERQSSWYNPSNDFFMWYAPRSPPVSIGGLYGEYLNKRSALRAEKQKEIDESKREYDLSDRVRFLEGLCQCLLTLPKETKRLRGRIFKLESIIQDMTLKGNCFEKEERFKKFSPKNEDLSHSTSEDEPDNKDDISPKEDAGDVYCYDVNGDVSRCFIPANILVEKGDCEHYKYTYSSMQEDEIISLADQRQQDDISKMAEDSKNKIQSEIQRLYQLREARLNKIAEEDKQRKFIGHMNSSASMKLAIERCVPKQIKFIDVVRSLYIRLSTTLNVPSMEELANQKNDLSRPFKRIDRIYLGRDLEQWLSRSDVGHCKFPWCNDISVDSSFWRGLCGLDDHRKGWLLDEHIDLWVMYMWHTREFDMDWAVVSCYFLALLLQGSLPKFYANNDLYPVAWSDVERRHWSLAMFHICSAVVTFYDSEITHDEEFHTWYLNMRECLVAKIHVILKEMAHGVPLAVDDPVQAALAYREKMIRFYFQHKMFCP
ncbi:phospholipase-like protein [Tanacetum coccineum]